MNAKPPAPPPMRQSGGRVPGDGLGFYLIVIAVCITFGIYCGMKMAGG